jgi:zinc transport system ATP-binding protein
LNQEKGITIVMISHDINSAIDNAKTILHLNEEVMFYGNSEEYANSQVGQLFLKGDRHV